MHACQSAMARSFPIPNPYNFMKLASYLVYNNTLKGTLHKECATFTLGLKTRHSKYYRMCYNKQYNKHTHLLDKTNFKGILPGLKTTELLYIVLNVCMHEFISWQIYSYAFINNYIL